MSTGTWLAGHRWRRVQPGENPYAEPPVLRDATVRRRNRSRLAPRSMRFVQVFHPPVRGTSPTPRAVSRLPRAGDFFRASDGRVRLARVDFVGSITYPIMRPVEPPCLHGGRRRRHYQED